MNAIEVLVHWLVSGAAIAGTAAVVPGFRVKEYKTALIASVILGAANMVIRPILLVLTLPLTILTLGLFIFVVDAIILKICSSVLKGFELDGWVAAILTAMVLTVADGLLHAVFI